MFCLWPFWDSVLQDNIQMDPAKVSVVTEWIAYTHQQKKPTTFFRFCQSLHMLYQKASFLKLSIRYYFQILISSLCFVGIKVVLSQRPLCGQQASLVWIPYLKIIRSWEEHGKQSSKLLSHTGLMVSLVGGGWASIPGCDSPQISWVYSHSQMI